MKPDNGDKGPAVSAIAMDILSRVLSRADTPGDLGAYLTEEVRDLTGAQCVVLFQCLSAAAVTAHRVASVNPPRRRAWAESPAGDHLYETVHEIPTAQIWRGEEPAGIGGLLRQEGFELSIALPLNAGAGRVGVMLVLGLPDEEHIASAFNLLNALSTVVALVWRNAMLYENQEERVRERTAELRNLNKELEERVTARTTALENKTLELRNNQRAFMNIVEDLNEKTAQLEEANVKLQGLDRLKSMFIASMSHELRTPLNSIIGFSSILADEWLGPVNEEQKKNLVTVVRAGKHLLALINDVIDVSKIEAGKIEATIDDFDLFDLMVETAEIFTKEISGKGLEFVIAPLHLPMLTDRRRLSQCLINLLGNSVKFTEYGGIKATARVVGQGEISGRQVGDLVELAVEDTGIGIREEDVKKLFGAFVRLVTPETMAVKGTGLGLYLTRKIAREILGGEIEVESIYGKGSRFTIRIPVNIQEVAHDTEEK